MREANQRLNEQVEQRTAELTELSQHLIRVSEEEKAKLARELHDTLGSNLTAINMDLNWIQRRLPEGSREMRERLQRVLQMLAETVELKHEVIEGLRPESPRQSRPGVRDALALSRVHAPHRPALRHRRAGRLRRPGSGLVDRVLPHRPGGADQHHQARAGDPRADHLGARAGRHAAAHRRRRRRAWRRRRWPSRSRTAWSGMRERMREMGGTFADPAPGRAAAAPSSRPSSPIPARSASGARVGSRLTPPAASGATAVGNVRR